MVKNIYKLVIVVIRNVIEKFTIAITNNDLSKNPVL